MSRRHQSVLINDPNGLQTLPPNVLLALSGSTANSLNAGGDIFVNFEVVEGDGGTIFTVVPVEESGATASTPTAGANTGDGTVSAVTTSLTTVAEDWTITCTDDSVEGAEVWSVVGTVSGAQQDATTGVEYTSDGGEITFTISAGNTAFVAADEFTFSTIKTASYIKANRDCRIILEGLCVRNDATSVGGITIAVGTEEELFGQATPDFLTGILSPVDTNLASISSTLILREGTGFSLRLGSNDVGATLLSVQVSSLFPE